MVKIKQEHLEQLKKQINKNLPDVSCGAILGYTSDGITLIHSLLELENEQCEKRENRYLITPQQYMKAEETAENTNLELIGFYYSRTGGLAPGELDVKYAFPGFLYLAVSNKENKIKASGWILAETRKSFFNQDIEIITTEENILSHKMAIAV
ncbi:MAG: hypothetical protein R6W90_05205 [Ignavibacteriaceae bacterium]